MWKMFILYWSFTFSVRLFSRSRGRLRHPSSPRRRAACGQRRGWSRVISWDVTPTLMTLSWGCLIRRAGTRVAGQWRCVVPAAGSIPHIHQRVGARIAVLRCEGKSRLLQVWTLIQRGVADLECRCGWFALPELCLSLHLPWIFPFPQWWSLSCSLYPWSLGPVWVFRLVWVKWVECSGWGRLMLSSAGAVPTGAWCWRAEEHFPVRAGGQWLMGEMRGWTVAGIMEEVTLVPAAESVWSWECVTVCVRMFRSGIRVARPVNTGWG